MLCSERHVNFVTIMPSFISQSACVKDKSDVKDKSETLHETWLLSSRGPQTVAGLDLHINNKILITLRWFSVSRKQRQMNRNLQTQEIAGAHQVQQSMVAVHLLARHGAKKSEPFQPWTTVVPNTTAQSAIVIPLRQSESKGWHRHSSSRLERKRDTHASAAVTTRIASRSGSCFHNSLAAAVYTPKGNTKPCSTLTR